MAPALRPTAVAVAALLACVGVAAAQVNRSDVPQLSLTARLGVSLFVNLLVGGLLVYFAPRYSTAVVNSVRENPVENGVAGLAVFALFIGAFVVLVLSQIGIVLAIPLFIAFVVVGLLGGTLGTVTLGTVLGDLFTDATLWTGVIVGAFVTSTLGLVPVLGHLVSFLVGSAGVGAVVLRIYRGY